MNRLNKVVSAVAVSLLIPSLGFSITESERLGKVKDLLKPISGSKSTSFLDAEAKDKQIDEALSDITEKIGLAEKDKKWLGIVREKRQKVDQARAQETLPELLTRSVNQNKEEKRKQFAQLFPMLQDNGQKMNAARLKSTSDSCPSSVSQFANMANAFSSDLLTQFQRGGQRFLKQTKEEKLALVKDLKNQENTAIAKIRADRKKATEAAEGKEARNFKDSIPKIKAGIEGLKELAADLDTEADQRQIAFIKKMFSEFIPKMLEENKDLKEVQQLAMQIQQFLEPQRNFAYQTGIQSTQDLFTACNDMKDAIQFGGQNGQPSLATSVMQVTNSRNDPTTAASYNAAVAQVSNDLKCTDGSDAVELAVGQNLRTKISSLVAVPDSLTLLQTVMSIVPQISNSLGNAQGPLEEAVNDCTTVAEQQKAFQSMIAQAQTADSGQGPQSRTSSQRRPQQPGSNSLANSGGNRSFDQQGGRGRWH